MFERYTEKARRAIFFARYEASQFGSPYIETEHLLLGLLREDKTLGKMLGSHSVGAIRKQIKARTPAPEKVSTSVDLPLSQECKRVLGYAAEEAERASDGHIRSGHLLLGLMRDEKCLAAEVLSGFGVKISEVGEAVLREYEAEQAEASAVELIREHSAEQAAGSTDRPSVTAASPLARAVMRQALSKLRIEAWGRQFQWERSPCKPQPALRDRTTGRVQLDRDQPFDPERVERVEGGWTHYHCILCWTVLFAANDPELSSGYTNGQDWLCSDCYARFVAEAL